MQKCCILLIFQPHLPPNTPTHTHTHMCSVVRSEAAATIGRWWLGMRNKRVFKILKEAICAAVSSFFFSFFFSMKVYAK